jgi:acyl-CoA synthetase (AMP-forming)/AMP-acid ligase II
MSKTLVDVLRSRAEESADELAFLFLIDGETEGPRYNYAQLDAQARAIAVALRRVSGEQERALLVYPPGIDFVAAFFGCLYAGVLAVPVYPPRPDFLRPGTQPLAAFAADCQPAVVLGTGEMLTELRATLAGSPALAQAHAIATDELEPALGQAWRSPPIADEWLAMLQYTSGSTRSPRGVMISHGNLMHNEEMIHQACEHEGPGLGVLWLPPYHDMGLMGGLLQSVYHGAPCVMMSPLSLLQQPYRWLAAVSRYRADTSGGPGFAYDLCVERITPEQRKSLDLRQWSVAPIGSETIRPETLARFSAAFGECGFRPETWYPGYGLAEATMCVTGGAKAAPPCVRAFDRQALAGGSVVPQSAEQPEAIRLVGCGHTWGGQRLTIVDPATHVECGPNQVGEIWLSGRSVAKGYWHRPEETREVFQARLIGQESGPMLRTGDLGFMLDGELFVTGRLKDLIIVHGRNHAPQDIEETVQAVHPALRAGCGVAIETWRNGQPRVVVLQEVARRVKDLDPAALKGEVRQAVQSRHDLHLHELVLVESGSIPKTSSGKVQRQASRIAYEQGSLRLWRDRADGRRPEGS